MKVHNLKIKEEYYKEVFANRKRFEIRYNDRDYQTDDLIHFIDSSGFEISYDKNNLYKITYI